MLGKTHVVGTLALAHAGLIGYSAYVSHTHIKTDVPEGTPELFGFTIGSPMTLAEYGGVSLVVTSLVLLLLRVGKGKVLLGYALGLLGGLLGLKLLGDSAYPLQLALVLLAFTLGSLLPDIDSETSTIGRYVKPISSAIPHRTITHTIWAVALIAGLGWYLESIYLLALAFGYAIHIAEDSFSRQGICWFYPLIGRYDSFSGGGVMKRGRKPVLAYRTGGSGETMMFYGAVVVHILCAGFVIWTNLA